MLSLTAKRIPLEDEPFPGEEICRMYDEHARRFMIPVYHHFACQIKQKKIAAGTRILDIGTGSGLLAIEIARTLNRDTKITGLDLSESMLRIASENIERAGLSHKIKLKLSSASAIAFPDQSFDIVVSNASLHHWKNPQVVFKEIARLTAPGGFFMVRDNLRLGPLFNPLISLICSLKGMSGIQHDMWIRAIRASYTISEAKTLIKQAGLSNTGVSLNPTFLDLKIVGKVLKDNR